MNHISVLEIKHWCENVSPLVTFLNFCIDFVLVLGVCYPEIPLHDTTLSFVDQSVFMIVHVNRGPERNLYIARKLYILCV